ncbi:mimitin, mitochondrial [Trichonephila inaurata madagascariensis]|uniref:Mimitin, mitochondrial n=1 Tax=Trichonephila inaurata madagascariensis TaxID=2747483 RepID=A0A8X6YQN9_9ARAC|nr:mimitin, mitochondrial [Trichonephila inaurata madagascariensis]
MSRERSILRMIVTNFLKTFKLLPPDGKLMGQDHLGNKYYEAASSNPHSMRKSKNRWFEPKVEEDWQQNLPAEWEAWLRGRRQHAPTEEEVLHNLSIAQMKKVKGDEIAAKDNAFSDNTSIKENSKGFPELPDFEKEPGQFFDKKSKYD